MEVIQQSSTKFLTTQLEKKIRQPRNYFSFWNLHYIPDHIKCGMKSELQL